MIVIGSKIGVPNTPNSAIDIKLKQYDKHTENKVTPPELSSEPRRDGSRRYKLKQDRRVR